MPIKRRFGGVAGLARSVTVITRAFVERSEGLRISKVLLRRGQARLKG